MSRTYLMTMKVHSKQPRHVRISHDLTKARRIPNQLHLENLEAVSSDPSLPALAK